jgi:glutathione S-transferase
MVTRGQRDVQEDGESMNEAETAGSEFSDTAAAAQQDQATRMLLDRGASQLPPRPWLGERQPPSAADLIHHVLWRANGGGRGAPVDALDLSAGLTLVAAARAEMDALETALLFLARAEGMTWPQISQSLGLRSAQAAQQRLDRLTARPAAGMD